MRGRCRPNLRPPIRPYVDVFLSTTYEVLYGVGDIADDEEYEERLGGLSGRREGALCKIKTWRGAVIQFVW
jgi:hypothetical protein